MITCSKKFTGFAAAHRQHRHDGHCALIHGHNWDFEFTFAADVLDPNGFVVDFGKLKWLRADLESLFDHTLLLNHDDPFREEIEELLDVRLSSSTADSIELAKIVVVPTNCGAEGIASWLLSRVNAHIDAMFEYKGRNLRVSEVKVFEDEKNFATVSLQ